MQVGDDIVHTRDWSLGGFAIYDMHRLSVPCTVDDVLCGTLGPSTEVPAHEFTATVVRMEPGSNMLACKFIDMSSECFNFLEKLLRWRSPKLPRNPPAARAEAPGYPAWTKVESGSRRCHSHPSGTGTTGRKL